ncbi:MAG: GNAT family N-acetyltransferase [Rhodospirillaceae bacterium]|jgi:N-acyl-L-homoserine lactone synthetase|nr:GNAT family N-acetyltransferase [Rhodospirillaceae bacterium]MBT7954201.1 GNAT family N-acetyltransferase [Rhodospirillaceae bacterium]
MINSFSVVNAHLYHDILPSQYRLRHRVFVQRAGWDVPDYNEMEFDQFDTPATVYLVWRDHQGECRAITRLIPTEMPYMLKSLWPQMVSDIELPSQPNIWEATRFGVDDCLSPKQRKEVMGELVCGCLEYGLLNGIDHYLCAMPRQIIKFSLMRAGCDVDFIGDELDMGGYPMRAARINITQESLDKVRGRFGINQSVLTAPYPEEIAA